MLGEKKSEKLVKYEYVLEALEYKTENVTFTYLSIINKLTSNHMPDYADSAILTLDAFTDKTVQLRGNCNKVIAGRYNDPDNTYLLQELYGATDADFYITKTVSGTTSTIATEAVDLAQRGGYLIKFQIAGSTLTAYRTDMSTPKLSCTDTDLAIGQYGFRTETSAGSDAAVCAAINAKLLPPSSPLPPAKAIIEMPPDGFKRDLKEISTLKGLPDFLYQEAKRYETLKRKFTDEEIEALLGYIPQHQVDLDAVTWGAFDYKDKPALCIITGDNLYNSGAISRQIEYAKSKHMRVFKPLRDLIEARKLFAELNKDYHFTAGVHNFAYQCIGHPDLEPLAVADYYDGYTQGTYPMKRLDRVPDIEKTINMWISRLKTAKILSSEKEKHIRKLKTVIKK